MLIIIIWIIRRYRLPANHKKTQLIRHLDSCSKTFRKTLLIGGFCLLSFAAAAQEKNLFYKVLHNGNVIGTLSVHQSIVGQISHIKIETAVKTRLIISLALLATEETIFENGVLAFSSTRRLLNGKEKTNSQIRLHGSTYKITNAGQEKEFNSGPIYFNMLSMYATEPKVHKKAYADNFRQFVPIEKNSEFEYKVTLPDGSCNYYTYRDGICVKVEVDNLLYALNFILTNQH